MQAIELIGTVFCTFDTAKKGFINFGDVRRTKSDIREIGLAILEKAIGKYDTQVKGSLNKVQFVPPDQKENTDFESNKERVVAAYQRQRIEAKVQNSLQEAVQEGRLKITAESWIKGQ